MDLDDLGLSLENEEPVKTIPKITEDTAGKYVIAAWEMGYEGGKRDVEAKAKIAEAEAKIADIQRKAQEDLVSRISKRLEVEPSEITILGDLTSEYVGYKIQRKGLGFGRDLEVPVYRTSVLVGKTVPVYDKHKRVTGHREVVQLVEL